METPWDPELHPEPLHKIHAKHLACLYASQMHMLLFGNNQSSRLYRYSPSSMTKSSNKGQSVGEKYSDPRQDTGLWVPARRHPRSPLRSTPGLVPETAPFPREKENFR
ncbi:hypothetical protein F2Q68_00039206 [Brassica cretica]|uniref:Uncharacterized protein n=1 Tax=Brassica cretica TaxID=69181 RepID=A0A8S9MH08_BRACR|nr:hypothetical protein F2Q68_00039206 [Brassica cretica]